MKTIALFALFSSLAAASPASKGKKVIDSGKYSRPMGAAYFLTNEPSGNYVVAAAIGSDGKLTLRQATSAQGVGSHGGPGNGTDPLFSQGAVQASAAGNIVAAVNAGSNSIAVFTIDHNNPTDLEIIDCPVPSGGEFPISVAINKAGTTVCALNGGTVNGVACFAVNTKKRTVKPIANTVRNLHLNQTTPGTGPPGSASHLLFSADGKQLIASVKGVPPTPGMLAIWDVAADGSLSRTFRSVAPASGGMNPFGMTLIPGQNAIFAADPAIGLEIFDLAGDRSSVLAVPAQGAICWSTFSSKTGNFYTIDPGAATVSEVAVQKKSLKPTLVKQYFQGNGTATIDAQVATVGNNDFLYILAAGQSAIKVMALRAPGNAVALQTLDIAGPARRAVFATNSVNLQGMATFIN
ncbi:hypothetical protein MKEN_01360000 [Mycena kentingensis (nom. inval.)]|nr:hypothetical protein MKEN_01360000 [Mycena kentingensis (nom. inval.)]